MCINDSEERIAVIFYSDDGGSKLRHNVAQHPLNQPTRRYNVNFHFGEKFKSSTVKGKVIPLQALTGPEGSRSRRLPDFKTIGT
jgi:hypothetical protein